jgi:hypothetical protein
MGQPPPAQQRQSVPPPTQPSGQRQGFSPMTQRQDYGRPGMYPPGMMQHMKPARTLFFCFSVLIILASHWPQPFGDQTKKAQPKPRPVRRAAHCFPFSRYGFFRNLC